MRDLSRPRAGLSGLAILLVLSISLIYFLRKDTYLLNKKVRLVSMRLLRFKELSLHRGYIYRIQFNRHDFRVYARPPKPDKGWFDVEVYPYEDSIEAATPGLTIIFRRGRLDSYRFGGINEKSRPQLIFYFTIPKNPTRKKGMIFNQSGEWRAL
jgi:hypothetical protein